MKTENLSKTRFQQWEFVAGSNQLERALSLGGCNEAEPNAFGFAAVCDEHNTTWKVTFCCLILTKIGRILEDLAHGLASMFDPEYSLQSLSCPIRIFFVIEESVLWVPNCRG
jgi:hypothetical protein